MNPTTTELRAKLDDLLLQATTERSHYYVASVVRECLALVSDFETARGLLKPLAAISGAMEFPASVNRREVFVWAESGGKNRQLALADADAARDFLSRTTPKGESNG